MGLRKLALVAFWAVPALAQPPFPGGQGGGQPGGPGGGFGGQTRKLVAEFDKDGDGKLNKDERAAARVKAKEALRGGFGGPPGSGFGGPPGGGGMGRRGEPEPKPGPKVDPKDVSPAGDKPLYDAGTLRTFFFTFENADWEQELQDFHGTDVEVPATLTVDGKSYPNVGVHFRGMSSYMMLRPGQKRSLNVSIDDTDKKQRLLGVKTLNLLNMHEDDTLMSTVLYSHIARRHIPAPKANFVKVVINGESWGVYTNVEQFNKEFTQENYATTKGMRWKVSGSPMGGGGLEYLGESADEYKRHYEIKSADDAKAWKALINLCKVLNKTPADQLEAKLPKVLDVDSLLWFLALDTALINCDGYWIRASDYSLFHDEKGVFHVIPHDMNEAFRRPMGPGMGGPGGGMGGGGRGRGGPGGPGGSVPMGIQAPSTPLGLDPLVGLDDARKPLRSKVLAVPKWKDQYLKNVRMIAEKDLDWKTLGPVVAGYRTLIDKEVERDTRKLTEYAAFVKAVADEPVKGKDESPMPGGRGFGFGPPGGGPTIALRTFADDRRKFLIDYKPAEKPGR